MRKARKRYLCPLSSRPDPYERPSTRSQPEGTQQELPSRTADHAEHRFSSTAFDSTIIPIMNATPGSLPEDVMASSPKSPDPALTSASVSSIASGSCMRNSSQLRGRLELGRLSTHQVAPAWRAVALKSSEESFCIRPTLSRMWELRCAADVERRERPLSPVSVPSTQRSCITSSVDLIPPLVMP